MGCNCNKGKSASRPAPQVQRPAPNQPTTSKQVPISRKTGQTQTFSLQLPDGRVRRYGSRLEADAALVRAGGVGTIT